ncbi:GNAT family N-acetyltransferase [Chitinimonas sp.]|uniref:GNAT family N-acetyltransferase n=1 Tax=Chitinimonas sp. TaxID=1934313 RepID=UPI002F94F62F
MSRRAAGLHIRRVSPHLPEAAILVAELDAYQGALYPAESNHLLDLDALAQPEVHFYLAYAGVDSQQAVGCAALVACEGYAELKRMYVTPAARGRGHAQALLAALEQQAGTLGLSRVRLETGIRQPEAINLYRRQGYTDCPPFGDYLPDPLSLFMQKALPPG